MTDPTDEEPQPVVYLTVDRGSEQLGMWLACVDAIDGRPQYSGAGTDALMAVMELARVLYEDVCALRDHEEEKYQLELAICKLRSELEDTRGESPEVNPTTEEES